MILNEQKFGLLNFDTKASFVFYCDLPGPPQRNICNCFVSSDNNPTCHVLQVLSNSKQQKKGSIKPLLGDRMQCVDRGDKKLLRLLSWSFQPGRGGEHIWRSKHIDNKKKSTS